MMFDLYYLAFLALAGLVILVWMGWHRYREVKRAAVNPEWAAFRETLRRRPF